MPELPEVEILVRHLAPRLTGQVILDAQVRTVRSIRPHSRSSWISRVVGQRITGVRRRAKHLLFDLEPPEGGEPSRGSLLGHLGMTGRMYLQPLHAALSPHARVVLRLADAIWVFEDVRGFGRLHFDANVLEGLGPEPLSGDFTVESLATAVQGSRQPIKVRLLDQEVVSGLGNIYANEALHRAGVAPWQPAGGLSIARLRRLHSAVREVIEQALRLGENLSLDFAGVESRDHLFYFGSSMTSGDAELERFQVYDREGSPCGRCGSLIRRTVQAARSTYYCPRCQR